MGLKNGVKQALRVCGHAFVITIHERLDGFERRADHLNNQNVSLAESQTALLQSSIHVVEALRRNHEEMLARTEELRQYADRLVKQSAAADRRQIELAEVHRRLLEEGSDTARQAVGAIASLQQGLQANLDRLSTHLSSEYLQKSKTVELQFSPLLEGLKQSVERLSKQLTGAEKRQIAAAESQTRILQEGAENARRAHSAVTDLQNYTRSVFDQELVRQICLETNDYAFTNPEVGLMHFLYSYLPSRRAIDVGAHSGDVSDRLLQAGYEVYAIEPFPPAYKLLTERLGKHRGFHSFNFAVGCEEGKRTLHLAEDLSETGIYNDATVFSSLVAHSMPKDLPFTGSTTVQVKNLAKLHAAGTIPADIGLVKIDTEGFDLEVIRGMGDIRYPVVAAEYWDTEIPFGREGLLYTLESLVGEMNDRGYLWSIVLYRVWGRSQTAFYCNHNRPVPNSWGNLFFFRDYALFAQAQAWCSAVLPRTYFKPVAGRPVPADDA